MRQLGGGGKWPDWKGKWKPRRTINTLPRASTLNWRQQKVLLDLHFRKVIVMTVLKRKGFPEERKERGGSERLR